MWGLRGRDPACAHACSHCRMHGAQLLRALRSAAIVMLPSMRRAVKGTKCAHLRTWCAAQPHHAGLLGAAVACMLVHAGAWSPKHVGMRAEAFSAQSGSRHSGGAVQSSE